MRAILPTVSSMIIICLSNFCLQAQESNKASHNVPSISKKTEGMKPYDGFYKFYWEEKKGKIWLEVDRFEEEFLYVNSLSAGVGSNDIGLDRNQLGDNRVVKFMRIGPKVLLHQPNYDYRAVSDNIEEKKSVEEAFAQSVLWGFKVEAEENDKVLIDLTPFLMQDAHGVSRSLKRTNQGTFKIDVSRSAIYLKNTKSFPQNSEFEALLTFKGEAEGAWLRSVAPTNEAISIRQHHSFIQLPDDKYLPRAFDARSGYYAIEYQDYATAIDQPLVKRFIQRHRLKKKDPKAKLSEAVDPIIYYLDRGAPEPIKSALIEGASWWNQAFEAAGYKDAFQVKVLPEGVDPMDVRYNLINWVHRSTRGWSYGTSVIDPRTGEILKGHVLLGSLRVRQDFLIAQGFVEAYEKGEIADPRLKEMALARLRQLSAHEVGHTLGLVHNFAASYNDRASVMDYPHPYIQIGSNGQLDFSQAYDVGIGDWDKRTILYGYQDFISEADEKEGLKAILKENQQLGLLFLSDYDARPPFGAHPQAHLWDNGQSAIEELRRLCAVRALALNNFSEKNIPVGSPMASLEAVLVPLYLAHRYQVEAVSKIIGGVNYTYAHRGDGQLVSQVVDANTQKEATKALLETLNSSFLALPERLIKLIPPQPMGYYRNRELFKIHTGITFDPIGAAESAAQHTIQFLLNPQRLTRIVEQHARNADHPSLYDFLNQVIDASGNQRNQSSFEQEVSRMVEKLVILHILKLAADKGIMQQVSATAWLKVVELEKRLTQQIGYSKEANQLAHYTYLLEQLHQFRKDPSKYKLPSTPNMPDGSPIGCGH